MTQDHARRLATDFQRTLRQVVRSSQVPQADVGADDSEIACARVRRILEELGCTFREEWFAEDWTALFIAEGEDRRIVLDAELAPAERCYAMLHFVAHAAREHFDPDVEIRHEVLDRDDAPGDAQFQEVEAEAWIEDLIDDLRGDTSAESPILKGLAASIALLKSQPAPRRASRRWITNPAYRKLRGAPVGQALAGLGHRVLPSRPKTPRTPRPNARPVIHGDGGVHPDA